MVFWQASRFTVTGFGVWEKAFWNWKLKFQIPKENKGLLRVTNISWFLDFHSMCLRKFAPASRGFEGFQRFLKYPGCCILIFNTLDNVSKTYSFALDCPFWVFTLEPHFFFLFLFHSSSSFFLSFHHAFKNSKFVQNR